MNQQNDELTERVLGAAIEVHRILGAGLSEVHYKRAMSIELRIQGISHELEVLIDLDYKGESIGSGKVDIFVERKLIVELKTVEALHPGHTRQVLAYLKAEPQSDTALLINFSHPTLKQGIKRVKLTT